MADRTDFNDLGGGSDEQINGAKTPLEEAKTYISGIGSSDPGVWFESKTIEHLRLLQREGRPDYERALFKARKAKVAIRELKQAVNKPESNGAGTEAQVAHSVELLDEEPLTMRRPITLLDGKAYAAIWPIVRITMTESAGKDGEVVKHDPPIVIAEPSLMVVSEEGGIFGIGHEPMDGLDITIRLLEKIPAEKAWSTPGVKAYRNGHRPDPKDVFCRMADVIDGFIDFDRLLADQRTMAEMCACYALATWFLDAFNVIGFLWPNGDRGSGKTQLLTVLAELSYLGQVILSSGSFASLRDMADYGATLAFDDAEGVADPKRTDPDKRALMLAGNHRGNTVPVKEPLPGGGWITRHVNTFCPRLFSATRLPDPILASRTIIVPLVRTPDRDKANADPLDLSLWPHDRRRLIDDLWALSLSRLSELPEFERKVNDLANLTGRNLEPWRAVMAIAMWLDENGTNGLFPRIDGLSVSYQEERIDLEPADLTALVVRALLNCASSAANVASASCPERGNKKSAHFEVKTATVKDAAKALVEEMELEINPDIITADRVGRTISKMRFKKARDSKRKGWQIQVSDLERLALSYGIKVIEEGDA